VPRRHVFNREELNMTTTNQGTATGSTQVSDLGARVREELVSALQQGQQLSAGAVTYTFDVASELLDAQRTFALKVTDALAPKTSA
jgi:hypothetical protein